MPPVRDDVPAPPPGPLPRATAEATALDHCRGVPKLPTHLYASADTPVWKCGHADSCGTRFGSATADHREPSDGTCDGDIDPLVRHSQVRWRESVRMPCDLLRPLASARIPEVEMPGLADAADVAWVETARPSRLTRTCWHGPRTNASHRSCSARCSAAGFDRRSVARRVVQLHLVT